MRAFVGHAKFVAFEAGGNVGVGLRIHIGVHAQAHRSAHTHLAGHRIEHLEVPEALADPLDAEDGLCHSADPACRRRRSRPSIQSTVRVSGTVTSRNITAAPRSGVKLKSALW